MVQCVSIQVKWKLQYPLCLCFIVVIIIIFCISDAVVLSLTMDFTEWGMDLLFQKQKEK